MSNLSVIETTCVVLVVFCTAMAGCMDAVESINETQPEWDEGLIYVEDPLNHEDPREFISKKITDEGYAEGEAYWAVFGNEEGVTVVNTISQELKKAG